MKGSFRLLATFGGRGVSAIGGMLFSVAVARAAGAAALGQMAILFGILGVASAIACRGYDMILLRSTAREVDPETGRGAVAILYRAFVRVVPGAVVAGVLAALVAYSGALGTMMPDTALAMLIALPLLTLLMLVAAFFKGLDKAWFAPMFEIGGISLVASPLVFAARLGGPANPVWSIVAAAVLLAMIAAVLVRREASFGHKPAQDPAVLLQGGQVDFMLIGLATFVVQAGAFTFVGTALAQDTIGLLRAAERFAMVVSFPTLAVSPFIAPRIARHARDGNVDGLIRVSRKAVIASIAAGGAPFLAMQFASGPLLSLMGPGFVAAAPYLHAMALAHMVLVATNPFAMLLAMSGRERPAMWINIVALVAAVVSYPGFSALFGPWGFVAAYVLVAVARSLAIAAVAITGIARARRPVARSA
ncbi:MAG: hypothetical protein KGL48_03375 [Sphingomonadales bacterium]|nr:hypothetical protein [Sphingomonadales bacterium]MDE2567941.1 hypothetical protein [Sphingomonadales bacterium]